MLGSVLDNKRKWNYFNTMKRKLVYLIEYKLLDKDIGLGKDGGQKRKSPIFPENADSVVVSLIRIQFFTLRTTAST